VHSDKFIKHLNHSKM